MAEVVRARLLALVDGRFGRPVTTVVAGAGFGKTTLLAQAMRRNLAEPRGIDAWVACQPGDEDPGRFTAACIEAIGGPARGRHTVGQRATRHGAGPALARC